MTRITFLTKNSHYCGYEFTGHANYARGRAGKVAKFIRPDIVCAAISILSQTCTNTLEGFLELELNCQEDGNKGFLKIDLPEDLSEEMLKKVDLVIAQMRIGLEMISKSYPKNVNIETKEV